MKKPWHPRIRVLLREHTDGLTTNQISLLVGGDTDPNAIRRALEGMPDVYIDRWADPKRGQYQAVWCVIVPPPDCPYPTNRFRPETTWIKKNAAYRNNQSFCLGRTPAPVQDQL